MVLLTQAQMALAECWLSCLDPLAYYSQTFLKLFGFPIFRYRAYLMKVY
jgi:hypothetical protein